MKGLVGSTDTQRSFAAAGSRGPFCGATTFQKVQQNMERDVVR